MAKTILIADDNPTIRKISLAKECRPDLIILDLSMPVINGLEAAREIKRIMPDVPIILFTIHADSIKKSLQAMNSPIDLVVTKTDMPNLVDHVRTLIPV
jgi:CheY-like chemotaxis protein